MTGLMYHQAIANVPAESRHDPDKWWRAGQYSDQFIPDSTGRGAFDYYFLCKGRIGTETCWTVITANAWHRKFEDPLHTGQAWYCPVCRCRYKTSFGTLCEWRVGGKSYICLATYPPISVENLKAGIGLD